MKVRKTKTHCFSSNGIFGSSDDRQLGVGWLAPKNTIQVKQPGLKELSSTDYLKPTYLYLIQDQRNVVTSLFYQTVNLVTHLMLEILRIKKETKSWSSLSLRVTHGCNRATAYSSFSTLNSKYRVPDMSAHLRGFCQVPTQVSQQILLTS